MFERRHIQMDTPCIFFFKADQRAGGFFSGMGVIFRGNSEEGVILDEELRVAKDPASGMCPECL